MNLETIAALQPFAASAARERLVGEQGHRVAATDGVRDEFVDVSLDATEIGACEGADDEHATDGRLILSYSAVCLAYPGDQICTPSLKRDLLP